MSKLRAVEHPALGVLTEADPIHLPDTYTGRIEHNQFSVTLSICPDGETMEKTLDFAGYIAASRGAWIAKATRDVSYGLLDEHNEFWSDGAPLDGNAFAQRIRVTDVQILGTGCLTVMFNDGGLFGGHALVMNYFDLSLDLNSDLMLEGSASTFG